MKNKRYKRLAKRIKGHCISNIHCDGCSDYNKCSKIYEKSIMLPCYDNIRNIERFCRHGK